MEFYGILCISISQGLDCTWNFKFLLKRSFLSVCGIWGSHNPTMASPTLLPLFQSLFPFLGGWKCRFLLGINFFFRKLFDWLKLIPRKTRMSEVKSGIWAMKWKFGKKVSAGIKFSRHLRVSSPSSWLGWADGSLPWENHQKLELEEVVGIRRRWIHPYPWTSHSAPGGTTRAWHLQVGAPKPSKLFPG